MAAPSTVKTYALNGVKKKFPIEFDYLSRAFVQVSLIGETRQVLTLGTDYKFNSATEIETLRATAWGPADGFTDIEIRRVTSATERLVNFNDASILRASDLNLAELQTVHIAQEARDLTADTIGVDNDGNLDARGRRIVNLLDPVDPGDAVTKNYVDTVAEGAGASAAAAAASASAASTSASNAASSASAASTSASNAASSASAASTSASAAATSASNAASSATTAQGYRDTALQARNTAQAWATQMNTPVLGVDYSSKYYANQSMGYRDAAATSASNAATSESNAAGYAASINPALLVPSTGSTGAAKPPRGTTAQRPTLTSSDYGLRFNTSINKPEVWDGTEWLELRRRKEVTGSMSPSGSVGVVFTANWVSRVTIIMDSLSTTGSSPVTPLVRVQESGTVKTTGYPLASLVSNSGGVSGAYTASNAGIPVSVAITSGGVIHGRAVLEVGNGYIAYSAEGYRGDGTLYRAYGRITSAGINGVLVTSDLGGTAINSGTVRIIYE